MSAKIQTGVSYASLNLRTCTLRSIQFDSLVCMAWEFDLLDLLSACPFQHQLPSGGLKLCCLVQGEMPKRASLHCDGASLRSPLTKLRKHWPPQNHRESTCRNDHGNEMLHDWTPQAHRKQLENTLPRNPQLFSTPCFLSCISSRSLATEAREDCCSS